MIPTIILVLGSLVGVGLIATGLFVRTFQTVYRISAVVAGFVVFFITAILVIQFNAEVGVLLCMPYGCILMGLLTIWLELLAVPRRSNVIFVGTFMLLVGFGLWIASIGKLFSAITK